MEDRKNILIVEDDQTMLNLYEEILGEKYNVTPVFYVGAKTEIPIEKFDGAISDGLDGDWEGVLEKVDAGQKILISGYAPYIQDAIKNGFRAISKGNIKFDKLARILEQ